jgi:hypothetical protein
MAKSGFFLTSSDSKISDVCDSDVLYYLLTAEIHGNAVGIFNSAQTWKSLQ